MDRAALEDAARGGELIRTANANKALCCYRGRTPWFGSGRDAPLLTVTPAGLHAGLGNRRGYVPSLRLDMRR